MYKLQSLNKVTNTSHNTSTLSNNKLKGRLSKINAQLKSIEGLWEPGVDYKYI